MKSQCEMRQDAESVEGVRDGEEISPHVLELGGSAPSLSSKRASPPHFCISYCVASNLTGNFIL